MGWTAPPLAVVVFGGGVLAAAVGAASVRKRSHPVALPLAVTMAAVAAWAVPHAVALGHADPGRVAFWERLRYPGTVVAPVAYFVVAARYAGRDRWLTRRTYALLSVVPAVTLVVVWTNPVHGLFWRSLSVTRVAGTTVLAPTYGPWYWVNLGYLYLVTAVSLLLLTDVAVRSGPMYRKQAGLMLLGGLLPLVTNVATTAGIGPAPTVDLTTTALAVSGLLTALALFQFDLLAVRPVARDRLVEELDDGVVVVGPDDRIRDFNSTAARVLDGLALDRPASAVLSPDVRSDGGELVVDTEEGPRTFRTRSTELADARGRGAGRIVYLNDVTEIVEREQRISVLNRILRHNVRNELNLAAGHLDILADHVADPERDHVERARESTRRVLDSAEKARNVERTLHADDERTTVRAGSTVERVVADARETHTDASVEYDPPAGGAHLRVVDETLFETAVAELVENAVVHADHESPSVVVAVAAVDDRVEVRVADDGPGIPDTEREVLTTTAETPLAHGSGLGLWLVTWTASLSGGDLAFRSNDPRGTVATLSLPVVDD